MYDRTVQLLEGPEPVFGEFNLATLDENESATGILSWDQRTAPDCRPPRPITPTYGNCM
jgi:hypothetical protein